MIPEDCGRVRQKTEIKVKREKCQYSYFFPLTLETLSKAFSMFSSMFQATEWEALMECDSWIVAISYVSLPVWNTEAKSPDI